ncbi:MAG: flagellar basal body P-ring protein FlgI [Phycisphaeraceae bacterium]|nr:flagellar basal body P-ring protein FlgI [Phycisphaeraceae bacterium]
MTRKECLLAVVCAAWAAALAHAQPSAPATNPGGSAAEPPAVSTDVTSIQELARLEGQGESVLRGIGIITGLKGTGDAGNELVMAGPLAKIYESNGNPLPDLKLLAKAKSAAIVMLECVIPAQGARRDDTLDVFVTASHSASSLAGGRLHLAALSGPMPGQGVYAMASGAVVIEDPLIPTAGRVRMGARMIRDVLMPGVKDTFRLVVFPHFRGYTVTTQIADTINSLAAESDAATNAGPIARAVDDVAVEVVIPEAERAAAPQFVARVMSSTMSPSLLRLPAQVIVNQRTGSIIVTGNVEVSAVAVSLKNLVITTTTPPPVATPANPLVTTNRWAGVGTTSRASERARIQDLIQAFRTLDVPIEDQIAVLTQIHRAGQLHARLIID